MNALISGAGIAGPALAWWLARRGVRPVVIERAPALRIGGHAIDLRGKSVDLVDHMGLLARVQAARARIRTLSFVRPRGKPSIDVDIPRAQIPGTRHVEIVRDDLVRILYEATRTDAEYVFGDSITAIEEKPDGARVTFERGATRTFDLVVGADGQHSATRRIAFGEESQFTHRIGAYIAIYSLPNLFGLEDRALLYNEPGRAVAYYTMSGNQRAKVVLAYRSDARALDLRDDAALKAVLRVQFRGAGWETQRLLDALDDTPDFYFDEIAQIHMPAWSRGRVVLLGDAAHGPSPLSGQGTTLAIVGARVLADALEAHPEVPAAFAAYEQRMRPFVRQNQELARGGLQLLVPGSRAAILLRNAAIRVFPLLMRLGLGFNNKLQAASNAIDLTARVILLACSLALSTAGCVTSFTGSAEVQGGRPGCERKCASVGLAMQAFVFMGEYSTACVCEVPGRAQSSGGAAAAAAAVGVMTQMRNAQDEYCAREDCGRFGD